MRIFSLDRPSFSEAYLTIAAPEPGVPPRKAAALFEEMAAAIRERGIHPIQEKVYGPIAEREAVLAARETALRGAGLEADLPCTYIDGSPGVTRDVTGLQLWGIISMPGAGVTVETRRHDDFPVGRLIRGRDFELLYLPHLMGGQGGGVEQAQAMFRHASRALRQYGFSYRNVVRTWIYLDRILDWYDEFNRARTDFHTGEGLDGHLAGSAFPASTGIQGRCGDESCRMDLLAVRADDGSDLAVRPVLGTRRQPDAFVYGSGFARAMSLEIEGRRTLFVSGTSSIDRDGRTAFPGDREGQALQTLRSIEALLEEQGGRLRDIALGTLFHKDEETLMTYRAVAQRLGVADLPLIPVRSEVCRPDLLIEIEAVALLDG